MKKEENLLEDEIKDLRLEFKKKRVLPAGRQAPKPWGKKERYIVLFVLVATTLTAAILAVSARDFKLPGLPRFSFSPSLSLRDLFGEEVIVVGVKKDYAKIISDFQEKTKNLSGAYALYVIDMTNGYSFGIDEDRVMTAASLIKLPVMLYAQGKVDETKIEAMGKRSDNAVFREMRQQFGDETLQEFIQSIGMTKTSLAENETTPREIGEFFKKYKDEPFMKYLVNTIYENWLTPGVPEGTKVVHKYGREVHVVNDAGIVYGPKPYIVVIMTQGVIEKEADKVFPELSRVVYDGMNQ